MRLLEKPRIEIRPAVLDGISEDQIAQHWKLYEGYVKNAGVLEQKLEALSKAGDFGSEYAELKRRWSYEINGVVLHELYFEGLKRGQAAPGENAEITKQLKKSYGGFAAWKKDFLGVAKMRGTGWVILYYDRRTKTLTNAWVSSHQDGHPAGFAPILVLDVWEHAYMVDWGADGRPDYVEAFFNNLDWTRVESRLKDCAGGSTDES
jgi:Fe-Mn family superoxide dismutase